MAIEIVDLPIEHGDHGDVPSFFVNVYQRLSPKSHHLLPNGTALPWFFHATGDGSCAVLQ